MRSMVGRSSHVSPFKMLSTVLREIPALRAALLWFHPSRSAWSRNFLAMLWASTAPSAGGASYPASHAHLPLAERGTPLAGVARPRGQLLPSLFSMPPAVSMSLSPLRSLPYGPPASVPSYRRGVTATGRSCGQRPGIVGTAREPVQRSTEPLWRAPPPAEGVPFAGSLQHPRPGTNERVATSSSRPDGGVAVTLAAG